VREALTLLGTGPSGAGRRWWPVGVADVPDQLVALALLRGPHVRAARRRLERGRRDKLFTVGLFSVADALLDAPMEKILAELPSATT